MNEIKKLKVWIHESTKSGYIECPYCKCKLEFEDYNQSFKHCQPVLDCPDILYTEYVFTLKELHCNNCNIYMGLIVFYDWQLDIFKIEG